jgi:hypothetical protein
MRVSRCRTLFLAMLLLLSASFVQADSVTVEGAGSTFIIHKISGFDGLYGAEREAAFIAAARVWADILVSDVAIVIDAQFTSLTCTAYSAVLGSAGPTYVYQMKSSAANHYGLLPNTWYPVALYNSRIGRDLAGDQADISAVFNGDLDANDNCLKNIDWYYGTDGHVPSGSIDFYEVVLHEIAHGVGMLSLVDSAGNWHNGSDDAYSVNLKDADTGKSWSDMTASEIASSMTQSGSLVWAGDEVNTLASTLSHGVNNGQVQIYAPSVYESGSSVSHFDTALTPNELMEPSYTGGASYDHTRALFKDIGWDIYEGAVNDVPVITGQQVLSMDEDSSLTISLSHLAVIDSDHQYPDDFSLQLVAGENYSVSGSTVFPDDNFYGTLSVPVTVTDGQATSDLYMLKVTVNPVNDVPVILGQFVLSVDEDNSFVLTTADLVIDDPDDQQFVLSVDDGDHYSVAGTSTVVPEADFNGALTIPVRVNDGEVSSDSFNLVVTINAKNDAPEILSAPSPVWDEDTLFNLSVADFNIYDIDSSNFTLNVMDGENYSAIGSTIVPAADFSGELLLEVTVSDGQMNSAPTFLYATVLDVNDAPELYGNPGRLISYNENYSVQFSATDIDSDDLTFSLSSSLAWLEISDTGLLTGTPALSNVGTGDIRVSVSDGEQQSSITYVLTVTDENSFDLSVSMTADQYLQTTGETVEVTVLVENLVSEMAANGYLSVELSEHAQLLQFDSDCSEAGTNKLYCEFSHLSDKQSYDIAFTSYSNEMTLIDATAYSVNDLLEENNWAEEAVAFDDDISTPFADISLADYAGTQDLVVADINADEVNDLLLLNRHGDGSGVNLYEFNRSFDTTFLAGQMDVNDAVNTAVNLDVNKDGYMDLVLATESANLVYLNDGHGEFSLEQGLGNAQTNAIISADINQDGYGDLIVANKGENRLYLNNQQDRFIAAASFGSANSTAVAVIDLNRDGYLDLAFANSDNDDYIYMNLADPEGVAFDDAPVVIGKVKTRSHALVVADFDGDGIENEIVVARQESRNIKSIAIYQASESGSLDLWQSVDSGDVISMSAADEDANGLSDLVIANDRDVVLQLRNEAGALQQQKVFQIEGVNTVQYKDLNSNGVQDLLIATAEQSPTFIFLNQNTDLTIFSEDALTDTEQSEPTSEVSTDSSSDEVFSTGSLSWFLIFLLPLLAFGRCRN